MKTPMFAIAIILASQVGSVCGAYAREYQDAHTVAHALDVGGAWYLVSPRSPGAAEKTKDADTETVGEHMKHTYMFHVPPPAPTWVCRPRYLQSAPGMASKRGRVGHALGIVEECI